MLGGMHHHSHTTATITNGATAVATTATDIATDTTPIARRQWLRGGEVLARPRAPSKKLLRPRQHTNVLCRTRRYKEGGCGLERDVRIPCAHDVDDVMSARRPLDQQVLLATCNRQASSKRLVMTVRVPEAQPEGRLVARAQGRRCA